MNLYRLVSVVAFVVACATGAAFFGACSALVPGDTGGKGEAGALVAFVVAAVACVAFGALAAKGRRAS